MAITEAKLPNTRSDHRIPKLRTRGRANRQKMLTAAERVMEETGGKPIRFSDIFEAAGVSRGSAYRIYNGIDDLMQDLASAWINNFVAYLSSDEAVSGITTWKQLSDRLVDSTADYWRETEETLRILPRVRSNVPQSYKQAAKDMTRAIASIYERHFVIPDVPDWLAVVGMYTQIGDVVFSDAVRRDGQISEQRLFEAKTLCSTYLALYLPSSLPARATVGTE
jgi:AcrR family transcriptional regulator